MDSLGKNINRICLDEELSSNTLIANIGELQRVQIAKNVKALCYIRGMTQEELACKSNTSHSIVNKVINNSGGARTCTLEKIAKALDVTLEELSSSTRFAGEKFFDNEKIAENVKYLCCIKEMTQKELACKSDISVDTVRKVMNKKRVSSFSIYQISKALGVSLEELLSNSYLEGEKL